MALGNEARLVLSFELVDKATAQATANLSKVKNAGKDANDSLQKGALKTQEHYQSLEKTLSKVSSATALLAATISAPLALAINTASKSNAVLDGTLKDIKRSIDEVFLSVGEAMIPIMQGLADKIKEVTAYWKNLNPETRQSIVNFAAWTAGLLSAVAVLTKFSGALLKIGDGIKFLGGGSLLKGGLVVAGLTLLIVLVEKLNEKFHFLEKAMDAVERIFDKIGGSIKKTQQETSRLSRLLTQVKGDFTSFGEGIKAGFDLIWMNLQANAETVGVQVRDMISKTFETVIKGVGDSVAQSIVYGKDLGESMKELMKQVAAEVISFLVQMIAKLIILRALGFLAPIGSGFAQVAASVASQGFAPSAGRSDAMLAPQNPGGGSTPIPVYVVQPPSSYTGNPINLPGAGGGLIPSTGMSLSGMMMSSMGAAFKPFASGGILREPVFGFGSRSGDRYAFGEDGPERFTPLTGGAKSGTIVNNITISGNNVRSQRDIDDIAYQVSKVFKRETMRV